MENKTLFSKTEKTPKAMRGQAALVYEALSLEGQTIPTITETILPNLVTRQDPERITAYYLCVFKKQGLVVATRPAPVAVEELPAEPETIEGEDVETEDENDTDDVDVNAEELAIA